MGESLQTPFSVLLRMFLMHGDDLYLELLCDQICCCYYLVSGVDSVVVLLFFPCISFNIVVEPFLLIEILFAYKNNG